MSRYVPSGLTFITVVLPMPPFKQVEYHPEKARKAGSDLDIFLLNLMHILH